MILTLSLEHSPDAPVRDQGFKGAAVAVGVYSRRQGPDFTSGQQRKQEEIYFPASSLFSTVDFIKAPISKLQLHPALKAARLGNVDTPNWL